MFEATTSSVEAVQWFSPPPHTASKKIHTCDPDEQRSPLRQELLVFSTHFKKWNSIKTLADGRAAASDRLAFKREREPSSNLFDALSAAFKSSSQPAILMGLVYNIGRGLVVAGIVVLFEAAVVYSGFLPGDANLLGEYAYVFLLLGVLVIAVSLKFDFLNYDAQKEEDKEV